MCCSMAVSYTHLKQEILLSGAERQELNNQAESEILKKYPPEAGWTISWEGSRLYLEKEIQGLCPEHQKRWHLGLDPTEKKVVVYLGPAAVGTAVSYTHLEQPP